MRIRGSWLLCEWAKPPERSRGGIWLPEIAQTNLCHAIVLAAGDGRLSGGGRCAMQGEPGAHVLFARHRFVPVKEKTLQVRDEDLLALIYQDEAGQPVLTPANDYLLIERTEAEERTRGGILLPQISQRQARRGRVVECGPGLLRLTGDLAGTRKQCWEIMNLPNTCNFLDRAIYWSQRAPAVEVTSQGRASYLLRAGDAVAMEEPEP